MTWAFAPEGSAGQVAASDSLVFVGDDAGNLYGVDSANGEEVWTQSFEHPVGTRYAFHRTLTVRHGALYALTGTMPGIHGQDFEIHRIDPESGEVLWSHSPGIGYHVLSVLDATPDALLVGSQDDVLGDWNDPALAVDTKTGERYWQSRTGSADSGVLGDERAFVGSYEGVTAIDRTSGARAWRRDIPDSTPVYRGSDDLFVGSKEYERSRALALDPASGETKWTFDDWVVTSLNHDPVSGGPFVGGEKVARLDSEGTPVWTYDAGGLIAEAPIAGGVLYGLTESEVFGLATDSGERVFRYAPGWRFSRPVAVANGVVVVEAGRSARLGGVSVDGVEQWTTEFSTSRVRSVAVGGGTVAASADGVLYGRPVQD